MKRTAMRMIVAGVLIAAAVSVALSETYYVSLKGNDANDGKTATTAFRTIAKLSLIHI